MAKNLLVCANSLTALKKINESEGNGQGYFLEGVFAELDTLNRNKRIYPKEEYLKHLAYLRDDIRKGEPLLGELDHPDDRFEVKLKEASHKIVDLWYDAEKNCVMGKIELLNTPNGKLAQSLVDQGIPLHISSRAAGTVGNDSKVSIQQIYTYDLVCKPGFAGAVLHRVNESEGVGKYDSVANRFLEESNKAESMNAAPQYGINENEVSIREVSYNANLRKEAMELKENDNDTTMKKNTLTEEESMDEKKKTPVASSAAMKLKSVFEDGEDDEDKAEDDDAKDSEKTEDAEDGVEIISVKAITSADEEGDGVEIKDVKADDGESSDEEEKEDGEKEDDKDSDEKTDECDTSECDGSECGDKDEKKNECGTSECDTEKKEDRDGDCDGRKCDPKKDALFDCNDIKKKKQKLEDAFEEIVASQKRKDECYKSNESLTIQKYPTFSMMSGNVLKEVVKLDESQKSKVAAYLNDHNFCTPELINENWRKGIGYEPSSEIWMKYAPSAYRELFERASEPVKESIRNTASYLLFENQYDVNNFWENTGLMESEQKRLDAEKFINNMPKLNENQNDDNNGLPYSKEFIQMITEMACEYNN